MKKSTILFFPVLVAVISLAFAAGSSRRTKPKTYAVSGKVWYVDPYCGGAAPPDGETSHTYEAISKKIYVRKKGSTAVIDSLTSSATFGEFSIKLPAGEYEFVEAWKTEPLVMPKNSQYESWDTACYRNFYKTPDGTVTVNKENKSDVRIVIYRYCAWRKPCCSYSGPKPPVNRGGQQPGHQE